MSEDVKRAARSLNRAEDALFQFRMSLRAIERCYVDGAGRQKPVGIMSAFSEAARSARASGEQFERNMELMAGE